MASSTPKRAAQDVCRICSKDLSNRSTNRFNLFRGTPPLCSLLKEALQLQTDICSDDGLPKSICRPCKTSIDTILKAQQAQQDLKERYATTCGQIRMKRLARTPAEVRAEQDVPHKAAAVHSSPVRVSARQLDFSYLPKLAAASLPTVDYTVPVHCQQQPLQSAVTLMSTSILEQSSTLRSIQVLIMVFPTYFAVD